MSLIRNQLVNHNVINTVLHKAALHGNYQQVLQLKNDNPTYFLEMLMTRDKNDDFPLDRAAARGHYEIVKLLVEEHKQNKLQYAGNDRNYNPLLSAIRWYCKVIDNTYDKFALHGKFNIGRTSWIELDSKRFNEIILGEQSKMNTSIK